MSISQPGTAADRSGFAGIAEALRGDVLRGRLAPGAKLPPISELAGRYCTTAVTVRRALRELEAEGLVRVEHGVGTFVQEWGRQYELLRLPGFGPGLSGDPLETRLLDRGETGASAEAAAALGVARGEPLWTLTRLRLAADRPIVYQVSYLAPALGELATRYSPAESLYAMLARVVGRPPLAAEETLSIAPLPPPAAGALGLAAGTPVWRSLRTARGPGGEPLVFDDACLPADRVRLRVERRAGQARVSFDLIDERSTSER